jgi:hypothetical protein
MILLLFATVVALIALAGIAASAGSLLLGHDHLYGLVPLLDLNGEHNLPSWYSSTALLISAALLGGVGAATGETGVARGWRALGALFLCLSLDEAAGIHELTNKPADRDCRAGGCEPRDAGGRLRRRTCRRLRRRPPPQRHAGRQPADVVSGVHAAGLLGAARHDGAGPAS